MYHKLVSIVGIKLNSISSDSKVW